MRFQVKDISSIFNFQIIQTNVIRSSFHPLFNSLESLKSLESLARLSCFSSRLSRLYFCQDFGSPSASPFKNWESNVLPIANLMPMSRVPFDISFDIILKSSPIESGHCHPRLLIFPAPKVPHKVVCLFWQKDRKNKPLYGEPLESEKSANLGDNVRP